jgi:hypothetical protein
MTRRNKEVVEFDKEIQLERFKCKFLVFQPGIEMILETTGNKPKSKQQ